MKIIQADQTVYDLCTKYPELKSILAELGFHQILNTIQFQTVARIMTLRKGSMMRNIAWEEIKTKFAENGFQLEG